MNLEEQAQGLLQALLSASFESCALITREFQDLPLSPGLYAVKHREHGLLYLGKAKKLRERFRGGHKACTWSWLDDYDHRDVALAKPLWKRIAFVPLSMLDVLKLGDELESILIHATQPPYNAKYPSRD
jgi:excinuclease UvrABC nuclease subunit